MCSRFVSKNLSSYLHKRFAGKRIAARGSMGCLCYSPFGTYPFNTKVYLFAGGENPTTSSFKRYIMKSKNSDLKISIGKIYKDNKDNYWVISTSKIDKLTSQKLYVGDLLAEKSYNLNFLENGEGWAGTTNLIEELQCHKCIIHEINKKENEEEIRKMPLKLRIKYLENENT